MAAKKKVKAPPAPARPMTAMHIGATKETVTEARHAIVEILAAPYADNATKVAALDALRSICSVSNTTVTGCSFQLGAA